MSLESRRERAERAILDAATAIPLPMDKLIMRHNAAMAAVRALWVSRRKWRTLAAQLNNELGNVRASHSAAEHYIDELEDEIRPLRVQRSDAYAILALVTAEVGASEDMRWEFLPEMVKALRVKAGELESQLNGGDQ